MVSVNHHSPTAALRLRTAASEAVGEHAFVRVSDLRAVLAENVANAGVLQRIRLLIANTPELQTYAQPFAPPPPQTHGTETP